MGRRAARALVGMGLAACALLAVRAASDSPVAAATTESSVVRGAVIADGTPAPLTAPDGWAVGRPDTGTYLVAVEGGASLSVDTWSGASEVRVTPVGEGVSVVTFTSPDGLPVDAFFTFSAVR